ncbi:hypothetical protein A9K97_gp068 [Tokyovirus A1]|uniref:hypothetical protein n=1 Tax=Tokyovirus A1 TaxID=1826170 RepID=UPI0007A96055|nr:hypothetical protein A9K97_gp068 [Tokyovirus A1]BAU80283.1 hypothetical protein [Tokyovirus A1]
MACVAEPLSLAHLSAFVVVEENVDWTGRVDELSRETIEKVKTKISVHGIHYRRGKVGPYIAQLAEIIDKFHRVYPLVQHRGRFGACFSSKFLKALPTPDTVQRMTETTKDQLFEILLFWEFSTPELIPDEFFSALCE